VEALEMNGVRQPDAHLAQLRNHLAVCTLAASRPFKPEQMRDMVSICDRLWLDIDSLPGLDPKNRRPFNQLMGSEGINGSFYQTAATRIFSKDRQRFFSDWAYNVRPATDDRPYFFDFFRWRSLRRFIKSHGVHWFQRLELGYAILVISFVQILAVALLLLLLPLFFWSRHRRYPPGHGLAMGYFLLIGLAYLALEMSLMQRFTLVLGDPMLAVAGVLSAFLFFSGCGSLFSQRWRVPLSRSIAAAVFGIALLAPLVLILSQWLLGLVSGWNTPARFLFSLSLLAPLAFLMGWPFPSGIRLLQTRYGDFMPWAWGINGFASVASAPLSVLLAMSLGFRMVLALAVVSYLLAFFLALRLEKVR
jgi:hypothetical protein